MQNPNEIERFLGLHQKTFGSGLLKWLAAIERKKASRRKGKKVRQHVKVSKTVTIEKKPQNDTTFLIKEEPMEDMKQADESLVINQGRNINVSCQVMFVWLCNIAYQSYIFHIIQKEPVNDVAFIVNKVQSSSTFVFKVRRIFYVSYQVALICFPDEYCLYHLYLFFHNRVD